MYLLRVLIRCSHYTYLSCVLIMCTDALIMCTDHMHVSCVLIVCTYHVYLSRAVIICTDRMHVSCVLIMCTHHVYADYLLALSDPRVTVCVVPFAYLHVTERDEENSSDACRRSAGSTWLTGGCLTTSTRNVPGHCQPPAGYVHLRTKFLQSTSVRSRAATASKLDSSASGNWVVVRASTG